MRSKRRARVMAVLAAVGLGWGGYLLHREWVSEAMIDAILAQNAGQVRSCLQRGADPNSVIDPWKGGGPRGTVLMVAVAEQNQQMVEDLLASGAAVNASFHGTALINAAGTGNARLLARLLDAGAAVEAKDPEGRTALIAAAGQRNPDAVRILLAHHARVEDRDAAGWSALKYARENGDQASVEALQTAGARLSFAAAVALGDLASAAKMTASAAELNGLYDHGTTLLQEAAAKGHLPVVRFLLNRGAAVEATSEGWIGQTALMAAAENGHLAIVRLLLDHGARVDATDNFNRQTALYYAVGGDHAAVIRLLLQRGADPNFRDERGGTPLIAAASSSRCKAARVLIQAGADLDVVENDGYSALGTAMLSASAVGDTRTVTLLRRAGGHARPVAAHLEFAYLPDADLRGVAFAGAHLQRARLGWAQLQGADLRGADLQAADLHAAALAGCSLTGARYDAATRWPPGFDPLQHGAVLTRQAAED